MCCEAPLRLCVKIWRIWKRLFSLVRVAIVPKAKSNGLIQLLIVSYRRVPLNSGPSLLLQSTIVSLRTVPFYSALFVENAGCSIGFLKDQRRERFPLTATSTASLDRI